MRAARALSETEAENKAEAQSLARRKGYTLRRIRDRDWNRPHIAAINPVTGERYAWASHWLGIVKFLKQAPQIEDGDR